MRVRLGTALAVAFSFLTARAYAAPIRGPYLQDLGSRQVAVLLELDAPHSVTLEVSRGTTGGGNEEPKKTSSPGKETTHELTISGLEPATSYRYVVKLDDGTSEQGTFTTAPEDDRPTSFVVYGDNRSNAQAHAAIVKTIRATPSDALVHTGDMVYDGSQIEGWNTFFSIERELLRERCVFPTIGNHEIALPTSDGALKYARMFRVPAPSNAAERWYTFRWGSARFFMLDAHDEFVSDERSWLEQALTAADAEPGVIWRFAVMHHGPYSSGLHGGNEAALLARVPELLRAHKVDMIFAGHDHIYERGDASGLRYLISGGGGAPLYKENRGEKSTLKFEASHHFVRVELTKALGVTTAIRLDGSVIERCAFLPGGAGGWNCGTTATSATPAPSVGPANGTPGSGPPSAPSPARRACGCTLVSGGSEWIGLLVAGALVATAALRRKRKDGSADDSS